MIDFSKIRDFEYYARNLLKIREERTRRVIPFIFNKVQWKLHRIWEEEMRTKGMVRLIILKARRQGISTYVDARQFHDTTTIPMTGGFIVTHDKASLGKIFSMAKLFYDELPKEFKPLIRYSNKEELVFENPDKRTRHIKPGLRSFMEVFSANTGTASRAGGYSFGHFSEVAFYDDAETLITSTVPAIKDYPGTVKVYESTGNGMQGFFYEQWKKAKESLTAKRKSSNFTPIFFSWLEFPEYSTPFLTEEEREDFILTMDEEEIYLQKKFGATLEQLNWRRKKILDFNGNVDLFHQEYPTDDNEAFIARGIPYFPKQLLLKLKSLCKPPIKRGDIDNFGIVENEEGPLKIWEYPKPGYTYVIAADAGEGVVNGDYSAIQVLRAPKESPKIVQVAEWKGLIDPTLFAWKIAHLANLYNKGMAVPECKHPGLTTLAELKHIYWNIYQWEYMDRISGGRSTKLGWETSVATKPIICSYTASCLTAGILEINSDELIEEMLTFVRNTTNSGEASLNCHDDLVMAYMIALFTLGQTCNVGSLIQQLERRVGGEVEEEPKVKRFDPVKYDHSFLYQEGQEIVDNSNRDWLNY